MYDPKLLQGCLFRSMFYDAALSMRGSIQPDTSTETAQNESVRFERFAQTLRWLIDRVQSICKQWNVKCGVVIDESMMTQIRPCN